MNENKLKFQLKTNPTLFLAVAVLFFASVTSISAKTLTAYRADVKEAKLLTANLLSPDEKDFPNGDFAAFERETVKRIRAVIPKSETVEWQGSSIETNNQWLVEKLDKFQGTPAGKSERWDILTEVGEQLDALAGKLDELESPSASNRAKDEDKQKLAEILRRKEYQKSEAKEESLFEKIWRKILQWIMKFFPQSSISPSVASGFQSFSFVLQMLLYALILGVIGFVVYRFAPFFIKRFRRRETMEKKERVILGERLADNETAQNLFSEAENLAKQGNLRGAIRKGYIALLCELSDRKIIGLSQHKTNRDYLRDVRKQNELHRNMSGMTTNFERHWYGFEEARETDWESFKNDYQKAVKKQ